MELRATNVRIFVAPARHGAPPPADDPAWKQIFPYPGFNPGFVSPPLPPLGGVLGSLSLQLLPEGVKAIAEAAARAERDFAAAANASADAMNMLAAALRGPLRLSPELDAFLRSLPAAPRYVSSRRAARRAHKRACKRRRHR